MKNFKTLSIFLYAAFMATFLFLAPACSDDDDDDAVEIVKTALLEKINAAKDLITNTEEGTATGQFAFGSKEVLQGVIDIAQGVYDKANVTQVEIDNSAVALTNAISQYDANKITPIAPEDLVAHWTFDDGTGTSVKDYSGNGFDGTFTTGNAAFGGGNPEWATDRYGNANKAVSFNEGAFVEVPYNTALNPKQITISVWINAAENRENNRFLGLHSWNGYKFQLQSANKSFFTASAEDGIYDRDTDPPLELNKWYHLAVTFGGGEMTFYINGVETQKHTEVTGDLVTISGHNLAIGAGSSKYADTADNYENDKIIPAEWGGFFHGSVDELRIYKTVLTPSQIESIYNVEKVQD